MFKDFGRLLLRRPIFTYDTLFEPQGTTRSLQELVVEKLSDDVFMEGLHWASPDLFDQAIRLRQNKIPPNKQARILHSLKKYVVRACSRSTPYGTYAGCNVVHLGGGNQAVTSYKNRHVRLDMQVLFQLLRSIANNESLRPILRYQVNNSVYLVGDAYRYLETQVTNGQLNYQIASFQRDDLLDKLLASVKKQPCTQTDLIHFLDDRYSLAERKAYTDELIHADFFVADVMSILTSKDPISKLQAFLLAVDNVSSSAAHPYLLFLQQCQETMEKLADYPLGKIPTHDIDACLQSLQELAITTETKNLFQVDLSHPAATTDISPTIVKNIQQAMAVLAKLTPSESSHERRIARFKQLFVEKYGDQSVPLMEAIDVELGIGFPAQAALGTAAFNEMADSLSKSGGKERPLPEKSLGAIEIWLQEQLRNALENGETEIRLSPAALEQFESQLPKLPQQIAVMGLFLANNQLLLQSVGGANGLSLLGRFGYMDDEITALCSDISAAGTDTAQIHAEILFSPEGRTANIARNNDILAYKIPYLTYLSGQEGKNIAVDDLYISVKRDRLCLFSKRLNKEVKPYLTHAHNYMLSEVPLYRFLASIQHQQKIGLHLHWGNWSNWLRFIPRMTVGNVVLQKATWQIKADEIKTIKRAANPLARLKEALTLWKLPRFICLVEGDNELFIDTDNEEYLSLLLHELKPQSAAKLAEWLLDEPNTASSNNYVQQFILPLSRPEKSPVNSYHADSEDESIQRVFFPGSEWMYVKIYCGAYVSDQLLVKVIQTLTDSLLVSRKVDQFFFIRYNDPHYHIRLRLHLPAGVAAVSSGQILQELDSLLAPYLSTRMVWKVQLDTYQREIDRYSSSAMLASEQAFFHDSVAFLAILQEEDIFEDDRARFYGCLQNIDNWLLLFGLAMEDRRNFCAKMAKAFSYEFDKETNRQIDDRFRAEEQDWKDILGGTEQTSAILTKRNTALAPLDLPLENLSSYIHMSINRWFSSNQRLLEFTLYKYGEKIYNQLMYRHDHK